MTCDLPGAQSFPTHTSGRLPSGQCLLAPEASFSMPWAPGCLDGRSPRSLEPPDVPLSSLDDAGCFLSPVGQAQFSDPQCGAAELRVRASARMFARWSGQCGCAVSTRQSSLSSWQGDRSPKEGLSVFGAAGPWTLRAVGIVLSAGPPPPGCLPWYARRQWEA